ncbi:hypothetical protein CSC70_07185 [Pseudoxanthomonas kalamensis DSM 18571]|uniref:hypothetical protein n=1 Tax=Pseudoxanthomonas kalamensis TaxID=289483 RepID=UPI001391C85E|nr:hypothetical protein [Pseudoxanthomonas kalamensis]KAF1710450.1 hypothetical protein CSC70_07185 [Pseudoxanthomonas kalamensis DSM 18571]
MDRSTLKLEPSYGGWQLFDNGKPVLWFPERAKAEEIATLMADARHLTQGLPTAVVRKDDNGQLRKVAAFG